MYQRSGKSNQKASNILAERGRTQLNTETDKETNFKIEILNIIYKYLTSEDFPKNFNAIESVHNYLFINRVKQKLDFLMHVNSASI